MFVVIQCSKCGKWSSREVKNISSYVFICRYCNKHTKLKQKRIWGLALKTIRCKTAKEAEIYCKKLNGNTEFKQGDKNGN